MEANSHQHLQKTAAAQQPPAADVDAIARADWWDVPSKQLKRPLAVRDPKSLPQGAPPLPNARHGKTAAAAAAAAVAVILISGDAALVVVVLVGSDFWCLQALLLQGVASVAVIVMLVPMGCPLKSHNATGSANASVAGVAGDASPFVPILCHRFVLHHGSSCCTRSTLTRSTALVPVADIGCAQSTGVTLTHGLTALGLIVQQQTLGAVGKCISLCQARTRKPCDNQSVALVGAQRQPHMDAAP